MLRVSRHVAIRCGIQNLNLQNFCFAAYLFAGSFAAFSCLSFFSCNFSHTKLNIQSLFLVALFLIYCTFISFWVLIHIFHAYISCSYIYYASILIPIVEDKILIEWFLLEKICVSKSITFIIFDFIPHILFIYPRAFQTMWHHRNFATLSTLLYIWLVSGEGGILSGCGKKPILNKNDF